MVIADAWRELDDVVPLSNANGLPLARTVKLVLDPLVIRSAAHPQLAVAIVSMEAAAQLRQRIDEHRDALAATAAWFVLAKKARRAARITDGHPQDLYFQRCFELATRYGHPDGIAGLGHVDAAALVREAVDEVHADRALTAAALRAYLADPAIHERLRRRIERLWAGRPRRASSGAVRGAPTDGLTRFLATCVSDPDEGLFARLVDARAGSSSGGDVDEPGAARALGLSALEAPAAPEVGAAASKSVLPPPFDRSILQRLFGSLNGVDATVDELVLEEVDRTVAPWQLAHEESRTLLAFGRVATAGLGEPAGDGGARQPVNDAADRLRARWQREAFVRRALRLAETTPGDEAESGAVGADAARGARGAVMRRLWVRVHGRELRLEPITADAVWDHLDGALRSVILDRRDRVKAALGRAALEHADTFADDRAEDA
jgi:hypothetical protein